MPDTDGVPAARDDIEVGDSASGDGLVEAAGGRSLGGPGGPRPTQQRVWRPESTEGRPFRPFQAGIMMSRDEVDVTWSKYEEGQTCPNTLYDDHPTHFQARRWRRLPHPQHRRDGHRQNQCQQIANDFPHSTLADPP